VRTYPPFFVETLLQFIVKRYPFEKTLGVNLGGVCKICVGAATGLVSNRRKRPLRDIFAGFLIGEPFDFGKQLGQLLGLCALFIVCSRFARKNQQRKSA